MWLAELPRGLTWRASVVHRFSSGLAVRPAHGVALARTLGAAKTHNVAGARRLKIAVTAVSADAVGRRRARRRLRPLGAARAALHALPLASAATRGESGEVSRWARQADEVAARPARLHRLFARPALGALDAVFLRRRVAGKKSCGTYLSRSQTLQKRR